MVDKAQAMLWVQLSAMDFVSAEGSRSKLSAPGNAQAGAKPAMKLTKRRRIVQPPLEMVVVQSRMSAKQIAVNTQTAFQDLYVMLADLQVDLRLFHVKLQIPVAYITEIISRRAWHQSRRSDKVDLVVLI